METRGILVDTSIIIDYLRTPNKAKSGFISLFQKRNPLFISSITVFELFNGATDNKKEP